MADETSPPSEPVRLPETTDASLAVHPQASADNPVTSTSTVLTADDFDTESNCPPLPVPEGRDRRPARRRPRLPGPGLPEAIGWTFGVLVMHIVATIALVVVLLGLMLASGEDVLNAPNLDVMAPAYLVLLVGGDQFLVLLAAVIAASLRFPRRLAATLNLRLPHPLHVLMIAGLMLPLSSLSGEVYRVAHLGWSLLVEQVPVLAVFEGANTVEWLQQMANVAPLPVMLLMIAVGPALGEELVFRGVIGRGLVARWGLWPGVFITSCLFAAVHFHPVHVLAVVPLGIAMHLVYLATRSFWAPVLLHFLNNSWATVASRMTTGGGVDAAAIDAAASPVLLMASVVAVIVLGTLLYQTRARYLLRDGREWSPGYVTVEVPAPNQEAQLDYGLWTGRSLAMAATAWVSFAVAFVAEIAAFAR